MSIILFLEVILIDRWLYDDDIYCFCLFLLFIFLLNYFFNLEYFSFKFSIK